MKQKKELFQKQIEEITGQVLRNEYGRLEEMEE